jgi:integrase
MTKNNIIVDASAKTVLSTPQSVLDDIWDTSLTHVLSDNSRRAYKTGLYDFAQYILKSAEIPFPKEQKQILKKATVFLPSISSQDIINYREQLRDRQLSSSTINLRLCAISNLFNRLQRLKIINENPASPSLVSRMKTSNISTTKGLSRDEVELLLKICAQDLTLTGKRDLSLIAILIHNGLRRNEVASLNAEKIGFINKIPIYTLTLKGGKKHTIEFIPEVWQAITRWITAADIKTGPIFRRIQKSRRKNEFIGKHRLTTDGVYSIIKKRIKETGITKNIHPHSLRHTYATLALLAGVPIQDVQISMGHSNTDTTFRYYRAIEQIGKSPGRALHLNW